MTFFVSSGNSTNPPTNQQLSPFAAVFVTNTNHCKPSPALSAAAMNSGGSSNHRVGNAAPPPFSLSSGGGDVDRMMATGNSSNQPYPPTQQQQQLGNSCSMQQQQQKRMGTDPSKFKTTICRNWEQTGMCGFRGCTFAHGVDDLRPPMRTSAMGAPAVGHSPLVGVTRSPGGNSNTSAAHNAGSQSCTRLDQLIEQFVGEVSKEKDLMLVHQEAFRTLKAMMRREQSLGQEVTSKVSSTHRKVDKLVRKLRDKDKILVEMTRKEDIPSALKARAKELQASTDGTVQELMNKIAESINRQLAAESGGGGPNDKEDADEGKLMRQAPLDMDENRMDTSAGSDLLDKWKPPTTRSYAAAVAGSGSRPRTGGLVPIGGEEHEILPSNSEKTPHVALTQNTTI